MAGDAVNRIAFCLRESIAVVTLDIAHADSCLRENMCGGEFGVTAGFCREGDAAG